MRLIAGALGGRRIDTPRGRHTRPTSERVREALFSTLGDVHALDVLDLYAGSGALAFEALSRGASRAVCVERSAPALRCLRDNARALELGDRCQVLALDVGRAVAALQSMGPFQLLLADPPWDDVSLATQALEALLAAPRVVAPGARLVLEHAARDAPPELRGAIQEKSRRYGDTALTFFVAAGATNPCATDVPQ